MGISRLLSGELVLRLQTPRRSAQLPDDETVDDDGAELDQEDPKVMVGQPLTCEFGIDPALASCTSVSLLDVFSFLLWKRYHASMNKQGWKKQRD